MGANLTPSLLLTESDTFGIELDGNYQPTDYLTLSGNFTYQDAKFMGDSPTSINGKRPDRLPKMLANVGAQLNASGFDASVFWNHQSKTFQDASNNVPLFAYSIWRAEAGYTFDSLGAENKLRFSVGVWNLLNSQGLAEGNPRAGAIQTGGTGAYFNARPILPRRITAKLTFDF